MKKTILAAMISSTTLMSGFALAQEASVTVARPEVKAVEVKASPEKPTITSNLNQDQKELVEDYIKKNREISDLTHQEKILELQAKLSKLELDKVKAEKERDILLNGGTVAHEEDEEETSTAALLAASKKAEKPEPAPVVKKAPNPLESVFVTKIYGLDSNLTATVFYKGSILNVKAGDEIADGVRLVRIVQGGAVFSHGKQVKRVPLTTGSNAYAQSFAKEDDEDNDDDDRGTQTTGMATPIGGQMF